MGAILIPLRVDVLRLGKSVSVAGPSVDFTRMPYWNGVCEVNPDVANVSEELTSPPFQNRGFFLPSGTHLHWALPTALTRATRSRDGRTSFPTAPNRWLVTRSKSDGSSSSKSHAQWLVESDYVFPEAVNEPAGTIALPFPVRDRKRPFAFLGRQVAFDQSWKEPPAHEHLAGMGYRLTATGYEPGDRASGGAPGYSNPTFAASFGNCHSVFGCHDPDPPEATQGVTYDVVGWYSDERWDPLRASAFREAVVKLSASASANPRFENERRALLETYGWEIDGSSSTPLERTVCYARVEIASDEAECSALPDKSVRVAVGNTATEALSAYLAARIAPSLPGSTVEKIEEQLEALHLATRMEGVSVRDLGPKFEEARHDRGFSRVASGSSWTVRRSSPVADAATAKDVRIDAPLPDDIAELLDVLDAAERAHDRVSSELNAMQRQLFADWYKYMLCSYPPLDTPKDYLPVDEVRYFIEHGDLPAVRGKREESAALRQRRDDAEQALRDAIERHSARDGSTYELIERPGPRFYRPHEPVLLVVDDDLAPTDRHAPGAVPCVTRALRGKGDATAIVDEVRAAMDAIRPQHGEGAYARGLHVWKKQPFHPFTLEWSVEVSPLARRNNLAPESRRYAEDFIERNYHLDASGDLALVGDGDVQAAASIYTGVSILTPHAKFQLVERIHEYLEKRLLKAYFDARSIPPAQRTEGYLEQHRSDVIAWYRAEPSEKDPVLDLVLQVLALEDEFHALGQSLNGFNDALLMRRQTFQLPIDEPLGFDDARAFTDDVRRAVASNTRSAPQPHDDFHPIRTGELRVLGLRVVDTFGRTQRLAVAGNELVRTEVFTKTGHPRIVALPPRLVQPARLAFRWLSAASGPASEEMTLHPATSPIHGWVLPNNLDGSLMMYGPAGNALGSITQMGTWAAAPTATEETRVEDLEGTLGAVVKHLLAAGKNALGKFLEGVDTALETIDPSGAAEHEALALLVARPLAIVRATLSLELRGLPAVNQSWAAFERDLARAEEGNGARETDGITGVRFPVVLGDRAQSNDGLVGCWVETSAGYGEFRTGGDCRASLTPGGAPVLLTMLIDPRAPVHAKTGILPTKAIDIPREQYMRALEGIAVTFWTAPVLSPVATDATAPGASTRIEIATPGVADGQWSWVTEHHGRAEIVPPSPNASWGRPIEILEGWLELEKASD